MSTKKTSADSTAVPPGVHSEKRGVAAGRDMIGNVIAPGDGNAINATINVRLTTVTLPPPETVDVAKELNSIRTILGSVSGENVRKISRALDDADEETRKARPNKEEVGSALKRALDYAKEGGEFVELVGKLAPHITNAVAWLGSNWQQLLPMVGLSA